LRAFIYTLVAFSALIGPVVFKSAGEILHPALFGGIIINHRFVIELENPRDIDIIGTRHAISAPGAGNGR
jgi:hypothetical protein